MRPWRRTAEAHELVSPFRTMKEVPREALVQAGQIGDPTLLPWLGWHVTFGDRLGRRAALDSAARILAVTPHTLLRRVDEEVRHFSQWGHRSLFPHMVRRLADRSKDPVQTLGFLSMNADGYVREEATKELVARTEEGVLRYLLLRAVDHVDEISRLSIGCIRERFAGSDVATLAELVGMWTAPWFSGDRVAAVREDVSRAVSAPDGTDALAVLLGDPDISTRRAAARVLADGSIHPSRSGCSCRETT